VVEMSRLRYKLTKKEKIMIRFALFLEGDIPRFKIGLKVRATYLSPELWFYGKVKQVNLEGKFIQVEVMRTSLKGIKHRVLWFQVNRENTWVEKYDY